MWPASYFYYFSSLSFFSTSLILPFYRLSQLSKKEVYTYFVIDMNKKYKFVFSKKGVKCVTIILWIVRQRSQAIIFEISR